MSNEPPGPARLFTVAPIGRVPAPELDRARSLKSNDF
jgi:hypothetical protein